MNAVMTHEALTVEEQKRREPGMHVCMHVLGAARNDVRVMREATMLATHGYNVSVVDVEEAQHQPREEQLEHVALKHIFTSSSFSSTRFTRRPLVRALSMLIKATLRLLRTRADIYHAHDVNALPACYIAARLRRKPLVFDSHELPLSEITIPWRWLHVMLHRMLLHIVPRCASVITVSPPIEHEIQRSYHVSKTTLIRNVPAYRDVSSSNKLREALHVSEKTRIVLYQGYIQAGRGLDMLVRAAKFFEPDTLLVIMGKSVDGTRAQLEALIAQEGVDERVKIIPPAPYAELLDWTASADIGLIIYPPSYSMNVRMCLPNKFFEYLMAALPILASPLDAVSEIIHDYGIGHVISSLEPLDIAASINALLADTDALEAMRQHARTAAQEEFCWEKEGQRLVALYGSITHRK